MLTLTMLPPPCFRRCGITACMANSGPKTLRSMMFWKSAILTSLTGAQRPPGVVHQDVDTAVALECRFDHRGDRLRVRHVDLDCEAVVELSPARESRAWRGDQTRGARTVKTMAISDHLCAGRGQFHGRQQLRFRRRGRPRAPSGGDVCAPGVAEPLASFVLIWSADRLGSGSVVRTATDGRAQGTNR